MVALVAPRAAHRASAAAPSAIDVDGLRRRASEIERGRAPEDWEDGQALTWLALEREKAGQTADAVQALSRAIKLFDQKSAVVTNQLSPFDTEILLRWGHQQESLAYALAAQQGAIPGSA